MIRVILPPHLRTLINMYTEMKIDVKGRATLRSVINAVEARYPMLKGTIIDPATQKRRPLVRFYADEKDMSHEPMDTLLPDVIVSGKEPFLILGAIAGG